MSHASEWVVVLTDRKGNAANWRSYDFTDYMRGDYAFLRTCGWIYHIRILPVSLYISEQKDQFYSLGLIYG